MNNLEDVLAKHMEDWGCKNVSNCPHYNENDIRCSECEYLVIRCFFNCPRCAQDRLIEKLKILLRLEMPSTRLDTNPDGTYEDGFVDGKVAQLNHDIETINKILGVTNEGL